MILDQAAQSQDLIPKVQAEADPDLDLDLDLVTNTVTIEGKVAEIEVQEDQKTVIIQEETVLRIEIMARVIAGRGQNLQDLVMAPMIVQRIETNQEISKTRKAETVLKVARETEAEEEKIQETSQEKIRIQETRRA